MKKLLLIVLIGIFIIIEPSFKLIHYSHDVYIAWMHLELYFHWLINVFNFLLILYFCPI
jgi:hypothetical protein